MGWPVAIVAVAIIFAAVAAYGTVVAARAAREDSTSKASLADKYEELANETREAQTAMRADLAAVRASVEAIEAMMRDVG